MRNDKLHDILKETFGHDSFRFDQLDIITSVLDGKDTLAIMPTGGGKSVCYQVPALYSDGEQAAKATAVVRRRTREGRLISMSIFLTSSQYFLIPKLIETIESSATTQRSFRRFKSNQIPS